MGILFARRERRDWAPFGGYLFHGAVSGVIRPVHARPVDGDAVGMQLSRSERDQAPARDAHASAGVCAPGVDRAIGVCTIAERAAGQSLFGAAVSENAGAVVAHDAFIVRVIPLVCVLQPTVRRAPSAPVPPP